MPNITWYAHSSTHVGNNTCRINRKSFHTLVLFSFRILFIFLACTSIIFYLFLERHLFMHIAFVDKKNSEITCNCFMKLAVIILRSNLQTQCFIKHIGHLSFGSRKKNICTRTCNIKLERFLTRDWFVDRIILDYIFFLAYMQCINIFSLLPSIHTCAHIHISKRKVYLKKLRKTITALDIEKIFYY